MWKYFSHGAFDNCLPGKSVYPGARDIQKNVTLTYDIFCEKSKGFSVDMKLRVNLILLNWT